MHHTVLVNDGHGEWGRFFWHESDPRLRRDGSMEYGATWTAYSSFGVFGHYWGSMGEPFAEFIDGIESDYLLSKIARMETNADKTFAEVKRLIRQRRRDGRITKEEARDAIDDVLAIEANGDHAEVACNDLYQSPAISRCRIEWCDLSTREPEQQAVVFVKKLWPLFVKAVREKSMDAVQ